MFPEASTSSIDETLVEEIMTPQRPDDIRRISLKTLKVVNSIKNKNVYFINVLQPKDALEGNDQNEISVQRIIGEDCIGVEITSKSNTEIFLFSSIDRISYGAIKSESKWLAIVKDMEGKIVKKKSYHKT